jgi:hypothetical protein
VPLNKFVLKELDPTLPANQQTWTPVPACETDSATGQPALPAGADACLIGYDKGKIIVAHLLYRGTGGDPWFI